MASETPILSSSLPSDWRMDALGERAKLKYILDNGLFVDVTFKVGGDTESPVELIQAQSFILKMYSNVFETMFSGNFKENTGVPSDTIDVPDIEPSAFKQMLKFLNDSHLDESLTADDIVSILYAAKKYDILELEQECRRLIRMKISKDDAVSVLQGAQVLNEEELEAHAYNFIRLNFEAIMESDDFLGISVANLCTFIKDDDTVAFEDNIFKGMLRWASTKCTEEGIAVTSQNQRDVMKEAFHLIRFPIIPPYVLAQDVLPSGILTNEEIIRLFQYELTCKRHGLTSSFFPLPFNATGRNVFVTETDRLMGIKIENIPKSADGTMTWSNQVVVDQPVTITSFGFTVNTPPFLCDVHFKISVTRKDKTSTDLTEVNHNSVGLSWAKTLDLRLQRPLLLEPSAKYVVFFTVKVHCPEKCKSLDETNKASHNPKPCEQIVHNHQRSKCVTFKITSTELMPSIKFHF